MMLFFMLQPVAIAFQSRLAESVTRAIVGRKYGQVKKDDGGDTRYTDYAGLVRGVVGRVTTVVLLWAMLVYVWSPVYMLPGANFTVRMSVAILKLFPVVQAAVPYCT